MKKGNRKSTCTTNTNNSNTGTVLKDNEMLDDVCTEKDSHSQEESMVSAPLENRPTYKTYFEYTKNKTNERIGICLLCKTAGLQKEIKMKNGNTTGLKFHLNKDHKSEYHTLFGSELGKVKSSIPQGQRTLDIFTKVSTFLFNIIRNYVKKILLFDTK